MSEITGTGSLPALPAVLPAEVRNGTKEDKQSYQAALGFERMLVKQLTKPITESAAVGAGEDGQSGSPAAYREMISDSIADAITKGGGIGLAQDLYKQTRPEGSR